MTDTERLDWLSGALLDHCVSMPHPESVRVLDEEDWRTSIDEAMKDQKETAEWTRQNIVASKRAG